MLCAVADFVMVPTPSPSSSSTAVTTLNRLSKALIRSILRWTQRTHTKSAPFLLSLPKSLLQFNPTLLLNPKDEITINSTHTLHATVSYFIRSLQLSSLQEYQQLVNETFGFIRYLNEQDQHLLKLYQEHCFRNNESNYLSHDISIRIGEVVENKLLGYRGVCVHWTIDPKTQLQLITLLVDWYDFEQILHGSLPLQFFANEFKVVRDVKFTRIHHNMISDYFVRYDATLGIYIPKYSLAYTHPRDSQYLLQTYSKDIYRPNNNEIIKIRPRKVYASLPGNLSYHLPSSDSMIVEPSYHKALVDRHEKVVDISSEIQQFTNFIFQTILKEVHNSNVLPGLLHSEIKDPKEILTGRILRPRETFLEPLLSSHDGDIFINGLPAPFADLQHQKASHLGTDILHEMIVLLYSIEELLVQLNGLIQKNPEYHLSSLEEIPPDILFSTPTPPSFRAFLEGIPSSTRTATPQNELYLQYLYSIMTAKNKVRVDNPVISTSHDDQLQEISLQLLSKLFQIRQESEKILIARNQRIGGFSYFETLYQPKEAPQKNNESTTPSLPPLEIDYMDPPVLYRIGQVIKHKQFGYRGICTGYDLRPTTDATNWEGVKGLSLGQEQPFYRVRLSNPPTSSHTLYSSIGDC